MNIRFVYENPLEVSEKELEQIGALYSQVHGHKRENSSFIASMIENDYTPWMWKNRLSPHPDQNYVALAYDGNKIIGHNSYICLDAMVDGKVILAGFGNDSMVHPDYRRKGIYGDMIAGQKQMLKDHTEIKVTFGFPNTMNPFSKEPGETRNHEQYRDPEKILYRIPLLEKSPLVSNEGYTQLSDFPGPIVYPKDQGFSILKTPDHLRWRYIINPASKDYAILESSTGLSIVKIFKGSQGHILDLWGSTEAAESYLSDLGIENCSSFPMQGMMGYDTPLTYFTLVIEKLTDIDLESIDTVSIATGDNDVF